MFNPFRFLRLDTTKVTRVKKHPPPEIRKVNAEKRIVLYNTRHDWIRVQNFEKNYTEVTYYLQVNEKRTDLTVRKFIIPEIRQ